MAVISATGPLTVGDIMSTIEDVLLAITAARFRAEELPAGHPLREAVELADRQLCKAIGDLRSIAPTCDGRCRRAAPAAVVSDSQSIPQS